VHFSRCAAIAPRGPLDRKPRRTAELKFNGSANRRAPQTCFDTAATDGHCVDPVFGMLFWSRPESGQRIRTLRSARNADDARSLGARPAWVHEIKHDGFRFICRREDDRVRVSSRRGHDWTDRVPRIAEALVALARNAPFDFKEGRETL
jgi:ATP dependent DNA ligase domain